MAAPLILPVAQYAPDLPDYGGKGSANIRNVYPRTPLSYGPVGQPATYSGALTARCQGAAAFIDSGANVSVVAGDVNDLYRLKSGSTDFVNVSKSAGAYSTPSDAQWQFTYFNGDVIATNFSDPPQYLTLGSGSAFADLPGTPPQGRTITTIKNAFVAFGNTFDGVNGNMPQRIWWSAAGNAKTDGWPTPGGASAAQLQSGATDLLGSGGWVQAIVSDLANADGVVFQQYAIKRMMYVGPPVVFEFLPAENVRGTPAPYSVVVDGGIAYYLGQDGFYAFDGLNSQPIGANRVDRTFWNDVDQSYINQIVAAVDPVNKLIWWAYPGSGNSGGNPNHMLCYNWQLDRWSICDVTIETIARVLSVGYTLDELYTVLGYTLDTLPAPLDSSVWTGGRLQLGVFDTSHKLNYLEGPSLAAQVDTQELQPVPGRRVFVRGSRPLVDGVGTIPSVNIGHRETLQSAPVYAGAVAINALGVCPARTSGRYVRASITVPAGSSNWRHIAGIEIDAVPQGAR